MPAPETQPLSPAPGKSRPPTKPADRWIGCHRGCSVNNESAPALPRRLLQAPQLQAELLLAETFQEPRPGKPLVPSEYRLPACAAQPHMPSLHKRLQRPGSTPGPQTIPPVQPRSAPSKWNLSSAVPKVRLGPAAASRQRKQPRGGSPGRATSGRAASESTGKRTAPAIDSTRRKSRDGA